MSDIETPDAHPDKESINAKQYTNEYHDTETDQPVVEVLPPDGTPDNPMDTTTDVDREGNSVTVERPHTITLKGYDVRLRMLKNKQTAALSRVTKKRNELMSHMNSDNNLHVVKSGLDHFNELFAEYQKCFNEHCELIVDDGNLDTESNRYETKELSILTFRTQVQEWIGLAERRLVDDIDRHSSRSSVSTSGSSAASERTKAKARLAELIAEKSMLKEKQQLQSREQELSLNIEIAKTQARERVFAEADQEDAKAQQSVKGHTNAIIRAPLVTATTAHATCSASVTPVSNSVTQSTPGNIPTTFSYLPTTTNPVVPLMNSPTVSYSTTYPPRSSVNHMPTSRVDHTNTTSTSLNPNAQVFNPIIQTSVLSSNNTGQQMIELQRQQNAQMLIMHNQITSAMSLPMPEVPKFNGDPIEYNTFSLAFQARIASRSTSNADRLYYLQQHLEGEPRDLIGGCLHMTPDDGYAEAWTLLNAEYGDTYKISMAYLKMVMEWNPIPHDDSAALKHFSFFLIKCLHAMRSVSHMVVLNHPPNMQTVVLKLPTYLQHKWRDQVIRLKQQEQQRPQFSDIVSFVRNAAESANDPIYGKDALSKYDDASIMSKPLRHTSIQKSSSICS